MNGIPHQQGAQWSAMLQILGVGTWMIDGGLMPLVPLVVVVS